MVGARERMHYLSETCRALELILLPLGALFCRCDVLDQVCQLWEGSTFVGKLAQFLLVSNQPNCEGTVSGRRSVSRSTSLTEREARLGLRWRRLRLGRDTVVDCIHHCQRRRVVHGQYMVPEPRPDDVRRTVEMAVYVSWLSARGGERRTSGRQLTAHQSHEPCRVTIQETTSLT